MKKGGKEEVFLRGRLLREQNKAAKQHSALAKQSNELERANQSLEDQLEKAQRESNNYKLLLQARSVCAAAGVVRETGVRVSYAW